MPNIPFEKIPGQGALYYDYLAQDPRLERFYSGHHRNLDDIIRLANKLTEKNDFQRKFLSAVLRETNSEYGLTPEVEANLRLLEREDTLTVITGQQAGICTGPLYTLLKAISTIKISEYLGKTLDRPVIPMFWLETSDHDLTAVNHIYFPGSQGPQKFTYGADVNPRQLPVGGMKFRKDFDRFSKSIKEILPDNDFYDAVSRLMDETYHYGETFGRAFGKMLTHLLGRWGLIIIDSENVELKKLASPVITMKLLEKGRMNQLMQEQSEELERESYNRQIKIRSELLNVFILKDNNRIPLTLLGEMLSDDGTRVALEDDELLKIASKHPERFSPKVAFRPIVQDFLFPTVAYVGGPSELAYFAQLKKVYQFFEIEMPIIWPRASATLIDAKIQRHMQRTGIAPEDIFRNSEEVLREILERSSPYEHDEIFAEAKVRFDQFIGWLEKKLAATELPVNEQLKTSSRKMKYQLEQIQHQTFNRMKSRNNSLVNSWKRIQIQLFPRSRLQEKTYNIIYFLSRYGFWLMDYLMENLDITTDDHQLLEIPSLQ